LDNPNKIVILIDALSEPGETARSLPSFRSFNRENSHSKAIYADFTPVSWQDERKGAFCEHNHYVS
jgi:hypothetical protein